MTHVSKRGERPESDGARAERQCSSHDRFPTSCMRTTDSECRSSERNSCTGEHPSATHHIRSMTQHKRTCTAETGWSNAVRRQTGVSASTHVSVKPPHTTHSTVSAPDAMVEGASAQTNIVHAESPDGPHPERLNVTVHCTAPRAAHPGIRGRHGCLGQRFRWPSHPMPRKPHVAKSSSESCGPCRTWSRTALVPNQMNSSLAKSTIGGRYHTETSATEHRRVSRENPRTRQ